MHPNIAVRNVNKACPHPERYSAEDPQSTETEVADLLWGVIRAMQPDAVLETGTHKARTSRRMAQALQQNGFGHLDTLDSDEAHAAHATAVLGNLPGTAHHVASFNFTPSRRYQVALFDTTDKRKLVKEFERFHPWIDVGSIVAFHDTGTAWPTRETLRPLEAAGVLSCIDFWAPRGVTLCEVKRGPNV